MPPNILYIHSHDTGRYIQPYGHAVATPRLQRLAEEGVLFRQAFCAAPTCSPSRAALLTGMAPHCSGMIGLAHRGFPMTDLGYSRTLPSVFRQAGYDATLIGVQHVAVGKGSSERIGYHRGLPTGNTRGPDVAQAAAAFLLDKPTEPFFLDVGFVETHRPFPVVSDVQGRHALPAAPLPDTLSIRRDMAAFKESAQVLDQSMGIVFDALERAGLAGNTIVVATTDHGIAFPNMKCNLTDHGLGVMLLLRGPAGSGLVGGKVIDGMVSHVDIFPTLCELAGIDKPDYLQGTSLLPLVRGEKAQVREELFGEVTYHAAYEPMRCVRTERYKYIRRYGERTKRVLCNCDDSFSKTYLLEQGWGERPVEMEQLFDLALDPQETANLVGRAEMAQVLGEMKGRLERWMRATNDPLLNGPVPAPKGAQVNDVNARRAEEPCVVVK